MLHDVLSSGAGRERQTHRETAPAPQSGFDVDRPTMRERDLFRDVQSQSQAACPRLALMRSLMKSHEQATKLIRRDARAVVPYLELGGGGRHPQGDVDVLG